MAVPARSWRTAQGPSSSDRALPEGALTCCIALASPGAHSIAGLSYFSKKNLFWGLLAASRGAKAMVCGWEGLELV